MNIAFTYLIESLRKFNFVTDTFIFFVGGVDYDCFEIPTPSFQNCFLNTTEYGTIEVSGPYSTKYGPNLPFGIVDHCMVKLPNGTIYMIGGIRSDLNSTEALKRKTVSILNLEDDGDTLRLQSGPSIEENEMLLCGTYENIAGGINIVVFSKMNYTVG